jgi:hypothetical protein
VTGLEIIADHVAPERDGWNRQVTAKWQGHKIRARIRRNYYQDQCHFVGEVWSPATLSWNRVQSLEPRAVFDANDPAWKRGLDHFADPDVDPYAVTQDAVDELLAYAQEILS